MKKPIKISTLRKKADRLMQEWGREKYIECLVCGEPVSCLHHYFPKSISSALRYDEDNLIPVCNSCHFRHHNGDPRIHNAINRILGDKWLKGIEKKKHLIIKTNKGYYEGIIKKYLKE